MRAVDDLEGGGDHVRPKSAARREPVSSHRAVDPDLRVSR
jgi:hypothetical protein